MPGKRRCVEPGLGGGALNDPRDRVGMQPARGHMAVPVDGAEERPAGDLGRFEPGFERRDRAALAGQPRDADQAALPFLVGLRAPEPQHEPVRFIGPDVGDVEPDEFGPPKRADEPDQEQRAIAEIDEAGRAEGKRGLRAVWRTRFGFTMMEETRFSS